jgi:SAM-dependent methyltransferase
MKKKLRLNIGGGTQKYSNCINLELTEERDNHVDVIADVRKGIPFDDDYFEEVLMIHVIEHIERRFHKKVFEEIWRVLQPGARFIMSFPDFIEAAKAFIENKNGRRWDLYNSVLYGRQAGTGDYHVTAIEKNDITNALFNAGFKNVNYIGNRINATISCYKGEKLNAYL